MKFALSEGFEIEKQGFLFYVVDDKHQNQILDPQMRKKLKNLVVVTKINENVLITTYRNNDPFKYIAKKSKFLAA